MVHYRRKITPENRANFEGKERLNKRFNFIENSFCIFLLVILFSVLSQVNLSAQSNDECFACHSDNSMTTEKHGKQISLYVNQKEFKNSAHGELDCVDCHQGFNPEEIPHKKNIKPINCESCHSDAPDLHPFHPQMAKANGVGGSKDVNCKGCHGTHDVIPPSRPGSKFSKSNIVNACGECHKKEKETFIFSNHYEGLKEGVPGAPNCITCHKKPIVLTSTAKDTTKLKIAQEKLCLSCHLDNSEVRARTSPSTGFIAAYEHSIHGSLLNSGNGKAANCVNCHSAHDVKNGSDPTSTVNKFNIPNTCGQCHKKIAKEYKASIHGIAVLKQGSKDAPVCTDCHGEHNILPPSNPKSPVAYANVSTKVCAPCHSSVKLSDKYGMDPNRLSTYKSSYHGMAMEGGSTVVANCASCHGVHNILPPSNPKSTVYKGNLAKTCGKCHPGANENFAKGNIHVSMTRKSEPILFWIARIYIILIILTIGGMLFHNVIDFFKKSKLKKMKQWGKVKEHKTGHSLYLRMTVNERLQHTALALSFITLVITGFMLHYPDAWWVIHIRELSKDAFEMRSILHRIAGVVLIVSSLYHLYYLAFVPRGRKLLRDLLPVYKDVTDAIGVAKFNLGLTKDKPKLDRFSYVEKAEYWALIWGTIVMSITGIIMWFDNTFIGLLTKLGWDIANTIHFYEAWLATLAIIVWHFYFVIFSPDVYPMNLAWFKGFLSEEEMEDEHPLELERLREQEAKKEEELTNKDLELDHKIKKDN